MRLLYVADGRSPIARSWITYVLQAGHEVHLMSTFTCDPLPGVAGFRYLPVAFSDVGPNGTLAGEAPGGARAIGLRGWIRHWLGPWTVGRAARQFELAARQVRPELVHAMRIPFEGMLAWHLPAQTPVLVSVWGNDFTLHAGASPGMRRWTRRCMQRASGLHVDCRRDLRLAEAWGFGASGPSLIIPTNGGVRTDLFRRDRRPSLPTESILPEVLAGLATRAVVIQPRGFRLYVRNDTFFRAVPEILRHEPETHFLCPGMRGEPEAARWVARLGIESAVTLLPPLDQTEMAAMFQQAQVTVSPTTHDGTPNSLLEAMACGAFPVAGDLESIREWIDHGRNGLLIDPGDVGQLAAAVVQALRSPGLRDQAGTANARIVRERADYQSGMEQALLLYARLAGGAGQTAML